MGAYWGRDIAPPMNLKKIKMNASQPVCWWALQRFLKSPTQCLSRLVLSEPTGGVPEVWRFRQILFCYDKDNKKYLIHIYN